MNLPRRLLNWLQPNLPYLNIGLVLAAYMANRYLDQVFCQPVRWAAIVLFVSTSAFLVWPWLGRLSAGWRYAALFLQGALLPVCAYCIWFLGWQTYAASILWALAIFWLLLTPLLVWVPVFFAWQLVQRARHAASPGALGAVILGALGPLLAQGWAEYQFQQVEAAVARLPVERRQNIKALASVVPRNYLAERLAGTGFKYHNYFCIYDGVRPALHDPLVNVCLWIRGGNSDYSNVSVNPLYLREQIPADRNRLYSYAQHPYESVVEGLAIQQAYLNRQATLYHRLFPDYQLNAGCNCTSGHGTITVQAQ